MLKQEVRDRVNSAILGQLQDSRRSMPGLYPGNGWQSAQDLHTTDALSELVQCVNIMAERIFKFLKMFSAFTEKLSTPLC
jgi:hypothetical protein